MADWTETGGSYNFSMMVKDTGYTYTAATTFNGITLSATPTYAWTLKNSTGSNAESAASNIVWGAQNASGASYGSVLFNATSSANGVRVTLENVFNTFRVRENSLGFELVAGATNVTEAIYYSDVSTSSVFSLKGDTAGSLYNGNAAVVVGADNNNIAAFVTAASYGVANNAAAALKIGTVESGATLSFGALGSNNLNVKVGGANANALTNVVFVGANKTYTESDSDGKVIISTYRDTNAITGGGGNDTIIVGSSVGEGVTLSGGEGKDVFVLDNVSSVTDVTKAVVIDDFSTTDDYIYLGTTPASFAKAVYSLNSTTGEVEGVKVGDASSNYMVLLTGMTGGTGTVTVNTMDSVGTAKSLTVTNATYNLDTMNVNRITLTDTTKDTYFYVTAAANYAAGDEIVDAVGTTQAADSVSGPAINGGWMVASLGGGLNYTQITTTNGTYSGNFATLKGGAVLAQYIDASQTTKNIAINVAASTAQNTILGGSGNNLITLSNVTGGKGSNIVNTGAGKDTVIVGTGDDTITLGDGFDLVNVTTSGGVATLIDYKASEDVIQLGGLKDVASVIGAATVNGGASAAAIFGTGGTFVDNGASAVINSDLAYYTLAFGDTKAQAYVVSAGANGAVMSLSEDIASGAVFISNNNGEASDTVIGGSKADTIIAGVGDYVMGGLGNDSVLLTGATGARVGIGDGDGKDTVSGFVTGFDEEKSSAVYLYNASIADVSLTAASSSVKVGSGTLELTSPVTSVVGGQNTGAYNILIDEQGAKNWKVSYVNNANGSTIVVADDDNYSDIFYGAKGKTNAVNLSAIESGTVYVDLDGTHGYESSKSYTFINQIVGSSNVDNVIAGSTAAETLTGGANVGNTLIGGAGKDLLIGGTGDDASNFYYVGSGQGDDTIQGSGTVALAQGSIANLTKAARAGTNVTFTFGSDKVTLNGSSNDSKIKISEIDATGNVDMTVKVGATGTAVTTYESDVTSYLYTGTSGGTITYSGDDNVNIWLDGSQGPNYVGFDNINGSTSSASAVLVGSNNNSAIRATKGGASLWGGYGGNDTLYGGSGDDTFFFFAGGGSDVIRDSSASDKVYVIGLGISDISGYTLSSNTLTVNFSDGSQFQLAQTFKAGSAAEITFDQDNVTLEYDFTNKQFNIKS